MSSTQQLSKYELLRLNNIRERDEMWKDIMKAKAEFNEESSKKSVKKPRKKSTEITSVGEHSRRSERLKGNEIKIEILL